MIIVPCRLLLFVLVFTQNGCKRPGTPEDAANEFALDLYKTALDHETGNFIMAPINVYMVLAMVSYGANGVTRQELERALHLPRETSGNSLSVKKNFEDINHKLQNISKPGILSLGNKIFVTHRGVFSKEYQKILRMTFDSFPGRLNFAKSARAAKAINSWSQRSFTSEKIQEIVSADDLNSDTALVLANTAYFLGEWRIPSDSKDPESGPFVISEYVTKEVPMMFLNGEFRTGELSKISAKFLELPHQDESNSENKTYLYIILPHKGVSLAAVENNIDCLRLEDFQTGRVVQDLKVILPKFKIEGTLKLKDHLSKLGIRRAFSPGADLDGVTINHQQLMIDQVVHKVVISVGARRQEAAESSAERIQAHTHRRLFKISQPFLIVLATESVVLFTGRIVDPSL